MNESDKNLTTNTNGLPNNELAKKVLKDKLLSIESKAIFVFLMLHIDSSLSSEVSVEEIIKALNISEGRFYKHRELLIDNGYLVIEKMRDNSRFSKNKYLLTIK